MKLSIKSKPMSKWDQRFCEMAEFVSMWSKDKAKVGAVVFTNRGREFSMGYNGFPMGVEDSIERLEDNKVKQELVVHAEQNAVLSAASRANGATICVWGKPVCARCAGVIIQSGIKRVIAFSPESVGKNSKWYETGNHALQMFNEANVEVVFFECEEESQTSTLRELPRTAAK